MEQILITEKLKNLNEDIKAIGLNIPIEFDIKRTNDMPHIGGLCSIIGKNSDLTIKIEIREDSLNEDVISHELLHAKLVKLGYCRTYSLAKDMICGVCENLANTLKHILVYKEQNELGFYRLIDKNSIIHGHSEKCLSTLEDKLVFDAILAISAIDSKLYGYKNIKDEINSLPANVKNLIDLIKPYFIYDNVNTPFKLRKTLIKLLRILDNYSNNTEIPISYSKVFGVGYVPSKWQLDLSIKQLFNIKDNYVFSNITALESIAESQLSFIIAQPNKDITNIAFKDFLNALGHPIVSRTQ